MKIFLSIFVVTVMLSFTVSAPPSLMENKANAGSETKTEDREGSGKISNRQDDNTRHHGLTLKELFLIKEIMDEDMDNMPWLPRSPHSPRQESTDERGVQPVGKEEDNGKQGSSCSYMVCPSVYQPVCGSNKITYANICKLLQHTCTDNKLTKSYDGECETTGDDDYDEDLFDPVFGKLRDFLDDLTVEDLNRAISKIKARKTEIENEHASITTSKPSAKVTEKQPLREADIGPCEVEYEDTKQRVETAISNGDPAALGVSLPNCDEEGFYTLKQCSGSLCYCVNRYGKPTMGQAPSWEADELSCNQQESVDEAIETLRKVLGGNTRG